MMRSTNLRTHIPGETYKPAKGEKDAMDDIPLLRSLLYTLVIS